MSTGGVIAEFLASVGFRADEQSLKSSLTRVAAFGVAVKLAAAGIFAGMVKVATAESEMALQAEKLGTTTDRLEELGYVAEQSGSSLDAVTRSMEALVSRNPRIKDAAKALEVVGNRMRGMSEVQRKLFADRMGIDRTLIPMLTSDVSELREEFRKMYAVAGTDAKQAAEASKGFLAELAKLKTVATMLTKAVAVTFIGRMRRDLVDLRKVVVENFGRIRRVMEFLISIVLRVSSVISAFVYRAVKVISGLVDWFDRLDDGQQRLVLGLVGLVAAWKLLNLGFLATPMGMIITGLLGIIALVDDYLTFMEGGESYFDWSPWAATIDQVVQILKPLAGLLLELGKGAIAAIASALETMRETLGRVIRSVQLLADILIALFHGDLTAAIEAGKALFLNLADTALGAFQGLAGAVLAIFEGMWSGVEQNFPDFAGWASAAAQSITGILGQAVDWVRSKIAGLMEWMPDWVKDKAGLSAMAEASLSVQATSAPALAPAPSQAAAMEGAAARSMELHAKTDIHIMTSDPVVAGERAAAKQGQVNADMVRHMRGAAR